MNSLTPNSKCIFYHVPKTGGSTIYEVTKDWKNFKRADPNTNHVQVAWNPPRLNHIGIAVIRNPYDRFISAFYHMNDSCKDTFYYKAAKVDDCESLKSMGMNNFGEYYNYDPNAFLSLLMQGDPRTKKIFNKFSIFKSQYYWLGGMFGGGIHSGVKILINQEELEEKFEELASKINESCNWNKTVNKRITENVVPLSHESKDIIKKLYKEDFKYLFPLLS